MCKIRIPHTRLLTVACATAFAGLVGHQDLQAQGTCLAALGGGIGIVDANNASLGGLATPVKIGDTIRINRFFVVNSSISFETRSVVINAIKPNNVSSIVLTAGSIPPGNLCNGAGGNAGFICTDGVGAQFPGLPAPNLPVLTPSCAAFDPNYTVNFADLALSQTFLMCNNQNPPVGTILFRLRGSGSAVDSGGGQAGSAGVCADVFIPVIFPCISITKECVTPCTPIGQPIQFRGQVCNSGNGNQPDSTGNHDLTGIVVVDSPATTITFAATTSLGNPFDTGANNRLRPGECVQYTGSYSPAGQGAALCGPFTDTISVTAIDRTGDTISNTDPCINPTTGQSTGPRPPVTATCHVQTTPRITLTKDCQPRTITIGSGPQSYSETFVVCNTGDVPLTGVVINDSKVGAIAIGNLAVGQCVTNVQGPFPVTSADCPAVTDRATATGNNACPADATCPAPTTVSSSEVTCTVTINCAPKIEVNKDVACTPPSGVCDASLAYADTATGVAGASFCYRITVHNPGPEPLNNVTVTDPDIPGVAGAFPPTLGVGQTETRFFKKTWPVGTHVNTVTANGVGSPSGIRTNDTDSATAIVVPIGVECKLLASSSFDMDNNPNDNHVTLPASGPVTLVLTINNTGQADLSVAITGFPCTVDINGAPIPTTVVIPAGGSAGPFVCQQDVTCPAGASFSVSVTGTAMASATVPCIYDSAGNAVTTGPEKCVANVVCEQPTTCRVTGGGQLIPNTFDQSCIRIDTQILPFTSPNGLTIKKITHGGQLGAPFSQEDCGEILGNPCIRGEWQHTRHYEGQANPRDVFDMNFHSFNPKGQFDTLKCACLGCCDPFTGSFITPITVGSLCNPDDHKVCGPQPRPAPANAIIFTGIGRITPVDDVRGSRAAQAEWVIFRVYIEDRSEPGGFHPKGSVEPADIYCFQAWKTGIKTAKKPDFTTLSADFRRALGRASCDYLDALKAGTIPIGTLPDPTVGGVTADIQDCGAMHDGNHQIHPATGATCTDTP